MMFIDNIQCPTDQNIIGTEAIECIKTVTLRGGWQFSILELVARANFIALLDCSAEFAIFFVASAITSRPIRDPFNNSID